METDLLPSYNYISEMSEEEGNLRVRIKYFYPYNECDDYSHDDVVYHDNVGSEYTIRSMHGGQWYIFHGTSSILAFPGSHPSREVALEVLQTEFQVVSREDALRAIKVLGSFCISEANHL